MQSTEPPEHMPLSVSRPGTCRWTWTEVGLLVKLRFRSVIYSRLSHVNPRDTKTASVIRTSDTLRPKRYVVGSTCLDCSCGTARVRHQEQAEWGKVYGHGRGRTSYLTSQRRENERLVQRALHSVYLQITATTPQL